MRSPQVLTKNKYVLIKDVCIPQRLKIFSTPPMLFVTYAYFSALKDGSDPVGTLRASLEISSGILM